MSRKIATATAVFNACEHLELSAAEHWNRDDVRNLVGGGGFNVIDPLIKAWRKIKPLREVAPTTPSEVLHFMAESIEAHLNRFTQGVEKRVKERESVFEAAVDELSDAIIELESQLETLENNRATELLDKERLLRDKKSNEVTIAEKNTETGKLKAINNELQNLIDRLQEEKQELKNAMKVMEKRHLEKINTLQQQHENRLQNYRRELIDSNERSENRLLKLLDKERAEAKKAFSHLEEQLHKLREGHQALREENAKLTASAAKAQEQHDATVNQLSTLKQQLAQKENEYNRLLSRYKQHQSDSHKDAKLDLLHAQLLDIKRIIDNEAQ